jgi:hypothetical protein
MVISDMLKNLDPWEIPPSRKETKDLDHLETLGKQHNSPSLNPG